MADKEEKKVERVERKDNIIRSTNSDSNPDFSSILKLLGEKSGETFSLKDLGKMFSSTIKDQVSILDKTLNKILKSVDVSRVQSLVTDKVYMNGRWFDLSKQMATGSYEFTGSPTLKDITRDRLQSGFVKDKSIGVNIVGISDDVKNILFPKKENRATLPDDGTKKISSGILKELLKTGIVLVPLVSAVSKLISYMSDENGPFRGASLIPAKILSALGLDMIGNTASKVGLKFGSGTIGKFFSKSFLRKLPIVGGFFNVGMGLKRLYDGDTVGGLIDILSGFVNFIPVVGWPLSLAIDLLHAYGDIQESKSVARGNIGWKGMINDWLHKNMRYLPGLGTFVHLGEAVGYFSVGEIVSGVKSLAKAGLTTSAVFAPLVYLFENLDDTDKDITVGDVNISGAVRSIRGWISKNIKSIPVLSTFSYMGDAMKHFQSGDIFAGVKSLIKSGVSATPLMPVLAILENLNDSDKDITVGNFNLSDALKNVKTALSDATMNFLRSALRLVVTTVKKYTPGVLDWAVDQTFQSLGITEFLGSAPSVSSDVVEDNKKFDSAPNRVGEFEETINLQREQLEELKKMREEVGKTSNITSVNSNSNKVMNFNTVNGGSKDFKHSYRMSMSPLYGGAIQ
jgi:hypothetical protein